MFIEKVIDKNPCPRNESIEGVASAVLYIACRQCGVPRTLDEVSNVSRVSRKEISRIYMSVSRKLGLKLIPTSPADYIPRMCSGLNLHNETQSKAMEILMQASDKGLGIGKSPISVAAAAIYISAIITGDKRTQRDIAEVSGITEVTIRNRYKELAEELDTEIIL